MDRTAYRALKRAEEAAAAAVPLAGAETAAAARSPLALNTARMLILHGKLRAGRALFRDSILKCEGADELERLSSVYGFASVLHDLGDVTRALAMMKHALHGFLESLGVEHGATLSCMVDLAAMLRDVGDEASLAKAEELLREAAPVLAHLVSQAGEGEGTAQERRDSELLLNSCKVELAHVLVERGDCEPAAALLKDAVAARERLLAATDASTLAARASLGGVCIKLGRLDEAKEQLERAVKGLGSRDSDFRLFAAINSLGALHQEIAAVHHGSGDAAGATGHIKAAAARYREALDGQTALLGDYHPATVRSSFNLATALHDLGEDEEAREYYQQALAGFEKLSHPLTARCKECLSKLPPE